MGNIIQCAKADNKGELCTQSPPLMHHDKKYVTSAEVTLHMRGNALAMEEDDFTIKDTGLKTWFYIKGKEFAQEKTIWDFKGKQLFAMKQKGQSVEILCSLEDKVLYEIKKQSVIGLANTKIRLRASVPMEGKKQTLVCNCDVPDRDGVICLGSSTGPVLARIRRILSGKIILWTLLRVSTQVSLWLFVSLSITYTRPHHRRSKGRDAQAL